MCSLTWLHADAKKKPFSCVWLTWNILSSHSPEIGKTYEFSVFEAWADPARILTLLWYTIIFHSRVIHMSHSNAVWCDVRLPHCSFQQLTQPGAIIVRSSQLRGSRTCCNYLSIFRCSPVLSFLTRWCNHLAKCWCLAAHTGKISDWSSLSQLEQMK